MVVPLQWKPDEMASKTCFLKGPGSVPGQAMALWFCLAQDLHELSLLKGQWTVGFGCLHPLTSWGTEHAHNSW